MAWADADAAKECHAAAIKGPEAAISVCSAAIRNGGLDGSEKAHLFNSRGMAHQALREYEPAIQDYDQAIELDPDYAQAYNNRATAYHSKGIYTRALQDYTTAIKLNPRDPLPFRSRGITHFCLGHFDEALKDLTTAFQLDSSDSFSAIWLYLAQMKRDGVTATDLSGMAAGLNLKEWPGEVIRLFSGSLRPDEFLSAMPDEAAEKQKWLRCEALFFAGEHALFSGERQKAAQYFQMAIDTRASDDFEYAAAYSEMQRLKVR